MRMYHPGRSAAVVATAFALVTAGVGPAAQAADRTVARCGTAPGDWQGDGLCLKAADNRKVDAYLARARAAEPRISREVRFAADLSHADVIGFDHRLKSPESLKRKVATDLKEHPEVNTDKALTGLNDAVRYTLEWRDRDYTAGARTAAEVLADEGDATKRWRNTWGSASGYKALNTAWRAPGSHQAFEVQLHTPESKHAQEETHKIYEEERLPSTSPERKRQLQAQQDAIFAAVPVPAGAPELAPPAG